MLKLWHPNPILEVLNPRNFKSDVILGISTISVKKI